MNFKYRVLKSIAVLLLSLPLLSLPANGRPAKHPSKRAARVSLSNGRRSTRIQTATSQRSSSLQMKRQRAAEARREIARRRAEAARLAAIARQRAIDEAARSEVQTFISRDVTAGEDMEVRRVTLNALGDHAGTVVVMDPITGRIYSIVNQEWALRRGFKPCSTIKLVTGLAGLNEHVIDPTDSANISMSNRINLTDALARSNNTYFQQVGGQVGFDKMVSYARRLGLGEKTGINVPNETAGQLPAPRSGYAVNHMSSHGDDFKVTAVQLATLVSAMANGGKLLAPRVLRTAQEQAKFRPGVRRVVNLEADSLRYMVPGMVGAVNYGSGRRAHDPQATVAGKTGTCIENGTWVGLFASYAPLANPRLAVVVIARGADAHSHFPAAVAGRIYRELNGRFGTPTDLEIAAARATNSTNSQSELDEEDDDERLAGTEPERKANSIRRTTSSAHGLETSIIPVTSAPPAVRNLPANNNVRRVLMPIAKRPGATQNTTAPVEPAAKVAPQSQTRPRRVNSIER
jgi:penicillin-binding protein 2